MDTITISFLLTIILFVCGIVLIKKYNEDDLGAILMLIGIIIGTIAIVWSFNKEYPTTNIPVQVLIFDHKSKLLVEVNDNVESPFEFTKLEDRSMFQAKRFYIQNYNNYWGMEMTPKLKWEK